MKLRQYQTDLLNRCREAYGQGHRAVLMQAETGLGKTAMMAAAANGVTQKGNTAGIVMHRQELILQTGLTLAKQKIYHGMIAPDDVMREAIKSQMQEFGRSYFNNEAPIKVCSVQTMVRREYDPFGFLFLDEAHRSVGPTFMRAIQQNNNPWILGVTATPERLDGKGLGREHGGIYDALVEGPPMQWAIDEGYLCHPEVWGPPHQLDFSDIDTETRAGQEVMAGMVDKPSITGDAIKQYSRICPGAPAIAFCIHLQHARNVAAAFCAAGYRFQCIDGNMSGAERRAAILALATGRLHGLTSCEIVNEGTDIPVVTAAIKLRHTQSYGLFKQQTGRVLRPVYAPGFDLSTRDGRLQAIAMSDKPRAIILDHVGNCARHGLPNDPHDWSLAGRPKRGKRDATPPLPATRTCVAPECFAVFRASLSACPACGTPAELTRREIEYREGELVRMERLAAEEAERREYWAKRRAQADAQSEEELVRTLMAQGSTYSKAVVRARYILNARRAKAGATEPKLI